MSANQVTITTNGGVIFKIFADHLKIDAEARQLTGYMEARQGMKHGWRDCAIGFDTVKTLTVTDLNTAEPYTVLLSPCDRPEMIVSEKVYGISESNAAAIAREKWAEKNKSVVVEVRAVGVIAGHHAVRWDGDGL